MNDGDLAYAADLGLMDRVVSGLTVVLV